VELGRIDIITYISMVSTYLYLPREGHLEAVFHVFSHLGLHNNARVVFDPTYPAVDMGTFIKTYWKSMYGDVKEMTPSDALIPRGKEVDLRLFVDSDMLVNNSQGVQGLDLSYTCTWRQLCGSLSAIQLWNQVFF
jgi:hypothetical protein